LQNSDVFVLVRLKLPLVDGVRFGDVDEEERRDFVVRQMKRFDVTGPATERWSGVAPEHEHHRSPFDQPVESHRPIRVESGDGHRRHAVADAETVGCSISNETSRHDVPLLRVGDLRDEVAVVRVDELVEIACHGVIASLGVRGSGSSFQPSLAKVHSGGP